MAEEEKEKKTIFGFKKTRQKEEESSDEDEYWPSPWPSFTSWPSFMEILDVQDVFCFDSKIVTNVWYKRRYASKQFITV